MADVDVEGERADMGCELEEEEGKDSVKRPHPVLCAVTNGMPDDEGGGCWRRGCGAGAMADESGQVVAGSALGGVG